MTIYGNEIVRVTDVQTYFAQQVLNVYYYKTATDFGGTSAAELAETFWFYFGDKLRACQSYELSHWNINVESLDGSLDFGTYTIPPAEREGTQVDTNSMSPFAAYGIKLVVSTRQVRPGSKRISGVGEAAVGNGGAILTPQLTVLNTLADQMTQNLVSLLTLDVMLPVIVGFPHPVSPTGRPARLTRVDFPVVSASVMPTLTTQNTRKYGRGA